MKTIEFGPTNGTATIDIGNAGSLEVGGNSGGIDLSAKTVQVQGATLTSYQRAVMAGYVGTEGDFYTELSALVAAGLNDRASENYQIFNRTITGSGFALPGDGVRLQNGGSVTLPANPEIGAEVVISVEGQAATYSDGTTTETIVEGVYALKNTPNGWEIINLGGVGFMKYQSA